MNIIYLKVKDEISIVRQLNTDYLLSVVLFENRSNRFQLSQNLIEIRLGIYYRTSSHFTFCASAFFRFGRAAVSQDGNYWDRRRFDRQWSVQKETVFGVN